MLSTKIQATFWSDDGVGALAPEQKLAIVWLYTHQAMSAIGFVKVSRRQFSFDTGLPVAILESALRSMGNSLVLEEQSGHLAVLVVNFLRYQFGERVWGPKPRKDNLTAFIRRLYGQLSPGMKDVMKDKYGPWLSDIYQVGLADPPHTPAVGLADPPHTPAVGLADPPHTPAVGLADPPHTPPRGTESPKSSTYKVISKDPGEGGVEEGGNANGDPKLRWDLAKECLEFLNEMTHSGFVINQGTLYTIAARLLEVHQDVGGVRKMIARQAQAWGQDPKMVAFLRPLTLFDAAKFHDYFGQRNLAVPARDPAVRRRELTGLIEKSPANRESTFFRESCTAEQKDELKSWRRELAGLPP
jgi:uncharacterized phage protein (TIGR02220 family)